MYKRGERSPSNRLRFEEESPEAVNLHEGMTSGQLGPKSKPGKPKPRLRFTDEETPGGLPLADASPAISGQLVPKSENAPPLQRGKNQRLRFETDDTPENVFFDDKASRKIRFEDDDEQAEPTPPKKIKSRIRFEDFAVIPIDGTPGTPGDDDGTPPHASDIAKSGDAEPTPTPDADGKIPDATPDPKNPKQSKKVRKAKKQLEKSDAKLENAKEKLAAQAPPKKPGLIKRIGKKAGLFAWMHVHKKIHEAEHENVGIEAAHKTELAVEGVARNASQLVKQRIHSRPARRVRKLSNRNARVKANHAYQRLLEENPELKKKRLTRLWHKRRLQRQYAKQARQAAKATTQGGGIIARTLNHVKRFTIAIVKRSPMVWVIVFIVFLLLMLMQSCMALVTSMGNSTAGVVGATSYLAADECIDDASVLYTEWEANLRQQILGAETSHPDYDEFRFEVGDISHCPFELIAFLTAVYQDFTFDEIQATLYEIFNEQYSLEFISEMEIRTKTETHTGTDEDGNPYSYTVEVEYEWHIIYVVLTSQSFTDILLYRMDEEQTQHFNLLMITKGNRQYLESPFPFNWLPYVSSLYGYRIHPISGEFSRHWGLDIGLPEGTEILSGQNGTVIFADYAGDYGFLVVIDDGEGLVSRYAHCSVIYVTVGQTVSIGDVIARVGNTGASTGPHLHLEIIKNGRHLNPLFFTVTNHHLDF